MADDFPVPRRLFPDLDPEVAHFAGGGQTPVPAVARDAIEAFLARKPRGQAGYRAHWALADQVRAAVGRLIGCDSTDVAFLGNALRRDRAPGRGHRLAAG